jgi:hypothetical protein
MDYYFLITLPNQNKLLLNVNTHQLPLPIQIQILDWVLVRLSIEQGLSVVFQKPSLYTLIGNTEVLFRLAVLYNYLFKLFFSVH